MTCPSKVGPDDFFLLAARGKIPLPLTSTSDNAFEAEQSADPPASSTPARPLPPPRPAPVPLLGGETARELRQLLPTYASATPLPAGTRHIVFDTETTGIGRRHVVVQMAMLFLDADGSVLSAYSRLWRPPKWRKIDPSAEKVHGIGEERLKRDGRNTFVELALMQRIFAAAVEAGVRLVAFNGRFDCRLLKQTAVFFGVREWSLCEKHVLCTASKSRVHSPLRSTRGSKIGFSNVTLFEHLFKRAPDAQLHSALDDTIVTAMCYVRGLQKRWW